MDAAVQAPESVEIVPEIIIETDAPAPPDPKETAARVKGWRPKEEFSGDPEMWVDAKEFLNREPLMNELKHRGKEIKELKKTVDAMATHFQKAVETGVQRQIRDLQGQRREAISDGDVNRVEAIEREIIEARQATPDIPKTDGGLALEIKEFIDRNKWFDKNEEMRDFAVAYNENYLKKHPGDLEESLQKTEAAVKRAYPDEFTPVPRPAKEAPSPVEGATPSASNPRYSMRNLSAEQQLCCKAFVKSGVLTEKAYIQSLVDMGELK